MRHRKISFLISQPKHMLWALERTVSMRLFLLRTQNMCLKLGVRKYLQFYAEIFCLSKPVRLAVKIFLVNMVAPRKATI